VANKQKLELATAVMSVTDKLTTTWIADQSKGQKWQKKWKMQTERMMEERGLEPMVEC
jgi:hypothetical protein